MKSIFCLSSAAVLAMILCVLPMQAAAKTIEIRQVTDELPFVGTHYFNFDGGAGTGHSITINQNSQTTIQLNGAVTTETLYHGNYQNPLPIEGGAYYYEIKDNQIYMLNQNKELERGCYVVGRDNPDDDRCIADLVAGVAVDYTM